VRERGLDPGEIVEANKGVRLSAITDPDGNTIRFIGGFRVEY
jgi:glyoxylase I family protein